MPARSMQASWNHLPRAQGALTKLPDRSFDAEHQRFVMGPNEYYEATQRQRSMERAVAGPSAR